MKILVIPDLHLPYEHLDSLPFISAIYDRMKPDKVVCLGDELDYHAISFHEKDPDSPFSPCKELEKSIEKLIPWHKKFPNMQLLESNHGSLVYRKGKFNGIPRNVFKEYKDLLETPTWTWHNNLCLDGVHFTHQFSGNAAAFGKHIVCGHCHTKFQTICTTTEYNTQFVSYAGCLIDRTSFAFAYQSANIAKPALGCLAIYNQVPMLIPMILDARGRWTGNL